MKRKHLIILLSLMLSMVTFVTGSAANGSSEGYMKLSKEGAALYNQARSCRDSKQCLAIADKLYNLELKKGNKSGCCNAINLKVQYWRIQNDEKKILECIQDLRSMARQANDNEMYYYSYYAECEYYTETKRSLKAINIIRTLTNELKDKKNLAAEFIIDVAMGDVYRARLDEVHSNECYLHAIDKSRQLRNNSYVSPVYLNLARITKAQDTKLRESYLSSAIQYSVNPTDSAAALMGLAHLYSYEKKKDQFWKAYNQYLPLLARERISQRKYEKWYKANEAYRLGLEGKNDSANIVRQSIQDPYYRYQAQADYYATHHDFLKAYEYTDSLVTYLRSSQAEQNISDVAEIAAIHETERLRADAKQMRDNFTRSILTTTLICVLIVLVILVIWILRHHKLVRKLEGMSNELRQARDDAVNASKMKDTFIQNMSHEVRTPLNAVTGFAQLLALPEECFDPKERNEFIQHIQSNTHMLTMLIDDILNISDIESGNYHMVIESSPVNEICRVSIATVNYRVSDDVQLLFETDVTDEFNIETDARRVQQVLINFLTNAIKHTDQGTITLKASLAENPGFVTFSVSDTGEGVPPEQSEAIFNRFEKLDAFAQGTGLGLNICRVIADKLNGTVNIDKTYPSAYEGIERGARFFFICPMKQS